MVLTPCLQMLQTQQHQQQLREQAVEAHPWLPHAAARAPPSAAGVALNPLLQLPLLLMLRRQQLLSRAQQSQ
jgi:hypothetical protein